MFIFSIHRVISQQCQSKSMWNFHPEIIITLQRRASQIICLRDTSSRLPVSALRMYRIINNTTRCNTMAIRTNPSPWRSMPSIGMTPPRSPTQQRPTIQHNTPDARHRRTRRTALATGIASRPQAPPRPDGDDLYQQHPRQHRHHPGRRLPPRLRAPLYQRRRARRRRLRDGRSRHRKLSFPARCSSMHSPGVTSSARRAMGTSSTANHAPFALWERTVLRRAKHDAPSAGAVLPHLQRHRERGHGAGVHDEPRDSGGGVLR